MHLTTNISGDDGVLLLFSGITVCYVGVDPL